MSETTCRYCEGTSLVEADADNSSDAIDSMAVSIEDGQIVINSEIIDSDDDWGSTETCIYKVDINFCPFCGKSLN